MVNGRRERVREREREGAIEEVERESTCAEVSKSEQDWSVVSRSRNTVFRGPRSSKMSCELCLGQSALVLSHSLSFSLSLSLSLAE